MISVKHAIFKLVFSICFQKYDIAKNLVLGKFHILLCLYEKHRITHDIAVDLKAEVKFSDLAV